MKIIVDETGCVGAGQCALVAGELFDQDDNGIVVVLNEHPSSAEEATARRAAALCPARVISLVEAL